MTTCSKAALTVLFAAAAVSAWTQTPAPAAASGTQAAPAAGTPAAGAASTAQPTPAPSTVPQNLTWAVAEFGGTWGDRLALLLCRDWDRLPDHRVSDAERAALSKIAVDTAVAGLRKQASQAKLDLDKKKILGTLPAGEPDATNTTLAGIDTKIQQTLAGTGMTPIPDTLAFKAVWATGQDGLPWPVSDGPSLAAKAKTLYAVTGSITEVDGYLDVAAVLYSAVEDRVLTTWHGRFAPEEAPQQMGRASDSFREFLMGRPWSGLKVTANVGGTRIRVGGRWHDLPWSSDDLDPGPVELTVEPPGLPRETRHLTLNAGERLTLPLTFAGRPDTIVLETEPAGASLYVDSQYVGPSPQTIDRPLAVTRVRAQAPGYATQAWEIGPQTPSPSKIVLHAPTHPVSVPDAKDQFYWSLAAFSFSLTSTVFLGAWQQEQANLTSLYASDGTNTANYLKAYQRYQAVTYAYAGGVTLTSAIFVWMMFELGAYIAADESTLP